MLDLITVLLMTVVFGITIKLMDYFILKRLFGDHTVFEHYFRLYVNTVLRDTIKQVLKEALLELELEEGKHE